MRVKDDARGNVDIETCSPTSVLWYLDEGLAGCHVLFMNSLPFVSHQECDMAMVVVVAVVKVVQIDCILMNLDPN